MYYVLKDFIESLIVTSLTMLLVSQVGLKLNVPLLSMFHAIFSVPERVWVVSCKHCTVCFV